MLPSIVLTMLACSAVVRAAPAGLTRRNDVTTIEKVTTETLFAQWTTFDTTVMEEDQGVQFSNVVQTSSGVDPTATTIYKKIMIAMPSVLPLSRRADN